MGNQHPIGVFDSGLGGLTVLRALREKAPTEAFIYLGDTARVPYGQRSAAEITRFTLEAAEHLIRRGIKLLVIACNTASIAAIPALEKAYPDIPVIGVVEAGAEDAQSTSTKGSIAVIGTTFTINSRAYQTAIKALAPQCRVTGAACPLFVSLAEEGRFDGPEVEAAARSHLEPLFVDPASSKPDCLVLACTHFPPFAPVFRAILGPKVNIIDPARSAACAAISRLAEHSLLHDETRPGSTRFLVTADPERFARVGSMFLGQPLSPADVEVICLGGQKTSRRVA